MVAPPKNKWLEPSSLIGVAGFVWIVVGSYQSFQANTGDKIAALASRVSVNESRIAQIERQIERVGAVR